MNSKDKETHYLRCNFTEEELRQISIELARSTQENAEAEENKKAAIAQFSEKIASTKAKASMLARQINNGYEMREVKCEVMLDTPI